MWEEALVAALGASDDADRTVEQAVHHWTVVPTWLQWYYDPIHDRLYEQDDNDWYFWIRSIHVSKYHHRQRCEGAPILLDLWPATVQVQRGYRWLTGSASIVVELELEYDEWLEDLQQQEEFHWLTALVTTDDDGEYVAQAIRDGTGVAISDGSFKNAFGTAAWVLQGADSKHAIEGRCSVPGPEDWQSAYRSELCGLLGSIYCATTLARKKGIMQGKVRIGCDGLSAIQQISEYKITQTPLRKHFDLISAI